MNGQLDLITLISLIVVAVAILKLRSVLGQRTDEDDNRVERLKARDRDLAKPKSATGTGEVINMPRRDRDDQPVVAPQLATENDAGTRVAAYATPDPAVTSGLLAIAKTDAELDPDAFIRGAGAAYEMIISAFAEGNRKTLKDLLARDVYDGFVSAIAERDRSGEKIDQQFVGIKKADIVDAELREGIAYITVRFVSELITARRDRAGAVVDGDPQKIVDVTDIWTFSRDVSSARARSNLNWRLEETQAPN